MMRLFKRWSKPKPAKQLEKTTVRDRPEFHSEPAKELRAEARFATPRQFQTLPKQLTVRYFGIPFEQVKELWSGGLEELQTNSYEEYEAFMDGFVRASLSAGGARTNLGNERYVQVGRNSYEVWPLIHRASKPMPQTVIKHRVAASYESEQLSGVDFVYMNDKGNGLEKHLHRAWVLSIDETGFEVAEARGRRRYLYSKVHTLGVIPTYPLSFDETVVTVDFTASNSVALIETVTTTKLISDVTARLKRWSNNKELEVKDQSWAYSVS
jgi:hypothetical protein